jgi:Ricin-type beta-trefoil lectin domain-like
MRPAIYAFTVVYLLSNASACTLETGTDTAENTETLISSACGGIEPVDSDWIYSIGPADNVSVPPERVVDIANWGKTNRSAIHLWHWAANECNSSNQIWEFVKTGTSFGEPVGLLRNPVSGRCLDKSLDKPDADGNAVYLYDCNYTTNQLWRIRNDGDSYELVNQSDGRCLDISNYGWEDGATIQVWTCTFAWNQRWWSPLLDAAWNS